MSDSDAQQPDQPQTFTWMQGRCDADELILLGRSYFFTANLAERRKRLLVEYIDVLRQAVKTVKQQ